MYLKQANYRNRTQSGGRRYKRRRSEKPTNERLEASGRTARKDDAVVTRARHGEIRRINELRLQRRHRDSLKVRQRNGSDKGKRLRYWSGRAT